MRLDLQRLEKVKVRKEDGKVVARCPACAETGGDQSGVHLVIFASGKYGCAASQQDGEHRKRIFELVGVLDDTDRPPGTSHTARPGGTSASGKCHASTRTTDAAKTNLGSPAGDKVKGERPTVDWSACCHRLLQQSDCVERVASWRGWSTGFVRTLAEEGLMGLHEGCIAFPVYAVDSLLEVPPSSSATDILATGLHVFAWPGSTSASKAWYVHGRNVPLILGANSLHRAAGAHVFESQWDALSTLAARDWQGEALEAPLVVTRGTSLHPAIGEILAEVPAITFWPQNDPPKADGTRPSEMWLQRLRDSLPASRAGLRCARLPELEEPVKDWNDLLKVHGPEETHHCLKQANQTATPIWGTASCPAATASNPEGPIPLPVILPPVHSFDPAWLPNSLAPWITDIAERMQCPPDFPAVAAMVALSSVAGNRFAIQPQEFDSGWIEHPHLWGMIVGRPSLMKSPAMKAAMVPLRRLEKTAYSSHEVEETKRKADLIRLRMERDYRMVIAKKAVAAGKEFDFDALVEREDEDESAPLRRYVVNNASMEALGEVLKENPTGTLLYQDELAGLMATIEKEGNEALRAFLLTAWTGQEDYTFDRIERGMRRVQRPAVAVLGGIQPAVVSARFREAQQAESLQNDGFMQRFSLLVWPDVSPDWRNVDRKPDAREEEEAERTFRRVDQLDADMLADIATGQSQGIPTFHFASPAQEQFREWRLRLELRLRGGDLSPAMEAHLGKYRRLVPALAVLIHVAEWRQGPVTTSALTKALNWAAYLETHAARAYGCREAAYTDCAHRLLERLQTTRGSLPEMFSVREIRRRGWTSLTSVDEVEKAC
ncbi:MAG TPA: DUF3987 domain-containing protein, partial [Verrucomicrobium sp.]|nr:DUF3987 domain-containing protein [Verrucomicrobium sp.]